MPAMAIWIDGLPTSPASAVSARLPLLFSFEALAVFAFGISWFVKGQALLPILTDRELAEAAEAEPEPESVPVPAPSAHALIAR